MEKKIALILLMALCVLCQARELTKSDWQHVSYPAGTYLLCTQGLTAAGVNQETSDTIALALSLSMSLGKEYYDYRYGGVSTLEDLELSIIGIATSYYLNKALNQILRGKK